MPISAYNLTAYGVDILKDGRIFLAGYTSSLDFGLVRLTAEGAIDPTFGKSGLVSTAFGSGEDIARSLVIRPDGKIILAGYTDKGGGNYDFAVALYNSNGSLDTTFGNRGKVTTSIGDPTLAGDYAYKVGLQSDGKIIVSGSSHVGGDPYSYYDFAVVRYNSNGALDTSFGTNGKVTTPIGTAGDFGVCQYIQPDDKILVGGWSESNSGVDFSLCRYNSDGSLDSAFGTAGKITTPVGTNWDNARDMTLQPDGKIILAGSIALPAKIINGIQYTNSMYGVVRYNPDGSLDLSFGTNGIATVQVGFSDNCESVLLQPDGKILVGGWSSTTSDTNNPGWDFTFARFNADGTLDSSFDSDGSMVVDFDGNRDYLFDMRLRDDGIIVAAGFTERGSQTGLAVAMIGTGENDALQGTVKIDKLYGFAGDDDIDGGAGADLIDGGDGIDTAVYSGQNKKISVQFDDTADTIVFINGIADDTLRNIENVFAGPANDLLVGNNKNNALYGGAGSDELKGGGGDDVVDGGKGDDLIIGGDGAGDDTYIGGEGVDTIKYTSAIAAITVDLRPNNQGEGYATSTAGNDASGIGRDTLSDIENIIAGNYADVLIGSSAANNLSGGDGNDEIVGDDGNDTLIGGKGNDTLNGGIGNDSMSGGLGDDIYVVDNASDKVIENANQGIDTIQTTLSTLTLNANFENLIFVGSAAFKGTGNTVANVMTGGSGNDTLTGGTGIDTFNVTAGTDSITDFGVGGAEILSVSSGSIANVTVAAGWTATSASSNSGTANLSTKGFAVNLSAITTGSGFIVTNTGAAAQITGSAFADTLTGAAGNDMLNGGLSNDRLIGGKGIDNLTGGSGSDTFLFSKGDTGQAASKFDIITDFAKGTTGTGDLIDYSNALVIGGGATSATSTEASINQSIGIASFATGSGTTMTGALNDIASNFTKATDTAGEFAFFKINNSGNYFLFISDGVKGVGTNDVVVQLTGISDISSIDLTSGNLSLVS